MRMRMRMASVRRFALLSVTAVAALAAPTTAQAVQLNNLAGNCTWVADTGCSFTFSVPSSGLVVIDAVSPTEPLLNGARVSGWVKTAIPGTGSFEWANSFLIFGPGSGTATVTAASNTSGYAGIIS